MQIEGTEEGRDVYGPDVWVNYLACWVEMIIERNKRTPDSSDPNGAAAGPGVKCFIIPDCRFSNEVDWILKQPNGHVIHLNAPARNEAALSKYKDPETRRKIAEHPSETALDDKMATARRLNDKFVNADPLPAIIETDNDPPESARLYDQLAEIARWVSDTF